MCMNILILGMGYVGVTTGLVFAELGWNVVGYDPNERRLQALKSGKLPFYEPGLEELLHKHGGSGKIRFTPDVAAAVKDCEIIFICVGTPAREDGGADLQYIEQAARSIGRLMNEAKLVVIKSTVPVGTNEKAVAWIRDAQSEDIPFEVVSNPEFLREGNALHDALHPDRIIIGSQSTAAVKRLKRVFKGTTGRVIVCHPRTAELIKYASNAFLASKISFMNELARLSGQLGVNIQDVATGMGMDPRIGRRFLHAGLGYGGSCFPKDVKALLYEAREQGVRLTILEKVDEVNRTQAAYALEQWEKVIGSFQNKVIAVLGLAFKKNTDDLREAPSLQVMESLLKRQAYIQAHDPLAKLPESMLSSRLQQCSTMESALQQADAAIICSDWKQYADADWAGLKHLMKRPIVFDGKNMLNSLHLESLGYTYCGVGSHHIVENER